MAEATVFWNELNTRDPEGAKAFYGKTLGWTFELYPSPPGAPPYWSIKSGEKTVGGMIQIAGAMDMGQPEGWFTYFSVDDLDRRLAALKEAGGRVHREPFDIPGVGRCAIVADKGGAAQAWIVPVPGGM